MRRLWQKPAWRRAGSVLRSSGISAVRAPLHAVRRKRLERRRGRADTSFHRHPSDTEEPTMKTIANHLTRITMMAAMAAAAFSMQPVHAAQKEVRVVQLQPVVVTAKRIRIVQLETVVVTAKRLTPATTVVAQRNLRNPPV
jgi:hypothetical protein